MKKVILLLGLILGICNLGVTAFAEESQVEVQIDTRPGGKTYEGTESLTLDVYNLTEWREKRAGNEKDDKAFILNTYSTKEKLANFVADENLSKINQVPILLDDTGKTSFALPRYQNEKNAAYLILASGEKGNYFMLPIVVYLPQLMKDSTEYTSLLFNCKYGEIPVTPPTSDPPPSTTEPTTTPTKSTEPPITDSSEPRKDLPKTIGTPSDGGEGPKSYPGKELPSTNELIRNYCFLGLLLMSVGLIGLKKQGGKKL
ncbi:hypothetical protein P7D85_18910 [Enterococcus hulanensis]|uniref:Gram-positive pilin subunit D1 N-terminal domain-containing protein n=1 Tax=Enterococcus hulanensis TaxID=2559929 RepID=A0ABU3F3Z7_9ENTE|nr:pilin N-terminal domain-containing protein [Enterococcus hulanensis]MDT2601855.1 hypothetical protein [Enterococcus hulanensis]MDT2611352.1 hypothetical protein [Enterococcus hulanensis]MDT2618732.1 hypothetical protein [Enterococcus hulanensis]MDT2629927.1 hypothetical protein [Enterococcus hulanensis]MDT2657634.1 hypothetical protein [Enterococcus hulanensis]